ncbi:RNA polymerase sigma-70 factor [Tellurirhabdus bombi]|uniref:RNA polymerase sigma-70 factor n=1 Tax=Tellurirhabdus bombi TaxID=2907205 RepID=UPI001F199C2C|nr:RNA polymerase sigma-70 factor [Tellurirhabdus bombi]
MAKLIRLSTHKDWDDLQLLDALANDDRLALSELYNRYWYALFRVAYQKANSREVAEELVQDLFVGLWQKRATLRVRQVEHYLFSAIKYSVIDFIRTQLVHEKFREYEYAFGLTSDMQTDNQLAYNDLVGSIETELIKLPSKTQEVFRLSRFDGLSIPSIAQTLNLSEKTVEYHLSKALKTLRLQLQDFVFLLLLGYFL